MALANLLGEFFSLVIVFLSSLNSVWYFLKTISVSVGILSLLMLCSLDFSEHLYDVILALLGESCSCFIRVSSWDVSRSSVQNIFDLVLLTSMSIFTT